MTQTKTPRTLNPSELGAGSADSETILRCDETAEPQQLLSFVLDGNVTQVVQTANPLFETEFKASFVLVESPKNYFEFPLSTILAPGSIDEAKENELKIFDMPFKKSIQKDQILEAVDMLMSTLTGSTSLKNDVTLVADELITNAIYNAKFEETGVRVNRTEEVELDENKPCRLIVGKSDNQLVVVCEDLYGSLNIRKVMARIKKCYDEGSANAMTWGDGGAGLGSFMIFQNSISMYYGVHKNERTMIACVLPLGKGAKARLQMAKNIHLLTVG